MDTREFDRIFAQTLDDKRVSRGEKRALKELFAEEGLNADQRTQLRQRVFETAETAVSSGRDQWVVQWLYDMVRLLEPTPATNEAVIAEAHFSPGEDCRRRIHSFLSGARKTLDICVFTITDNHLADAIVAAHRRGVQVRVITDNHKAEDRGSDTGFLREQGVPVATDTSDAHMHHKFCIADQTQLVTGSYNWTRSAFLENEENITVTNNSAISANFQKTFDALWTRWG